MDNMKKKPVDEDKKMAKMKALKELRSAMSGHEKDGLGKAMGMKKVTVAAPSEEGLEKGLDKAKDLVKEMPDDKGPKEDVLGEDLDEGNEYMEQNDPVEGPNPHEDELDVEGMVEACESEADIDALMQKLQEKKAQLKK